MNIVLLESGDEVDRFAAEQRRVAEPFVIVALSPQAQAALRNRGLAHTDTLPYFNNEVHRQIVLTSEEWLAIIERDLDLEDGSGAARSYAAEFAFYARFFINYFLWASAILSRAVEQHAAERITVCAEPGQASPRRHHMLRKGDRPLALIARRFAESRGLACSELPAPDNLMRPSQRGAATFVRRAVRPALAVGHQLRRRQRSETVFVTSLGYNMDRVVRLLRRRFPSLYFVLLPLKPLSPQHSAYRMIFPAPVDAVLPADDGKPGARARHLAERMETRLNAVRSSMTRWQALLVANGMSFIDIFGSYITEGLFPYLRALARQTATLEGLLDHVRPRLILSPHAIDADAVLGELSTKRAIPSLSISHGTFVPPTSDADEVEEYRLGRSLILTTYGYTAVQTPWAERYLDHFRGKQGPAPIRTGNLVLAQVSAADRVKARARLLNRGSESRRVIVYATTLKGRSSMRFQIHETLDEHLAGIRDMVASVRAQPNLHLVIKLHPGGALAEDDVRTLVPDVNCDQISLESKVPFARVLAAADLVVSYSSTAIEDAIQNGIPVLLYDRWSRYQHLPAASVNSGATPVLSAVYYVSEPGALSAALNWITGSHPVGSLSGAQLERHVYPANAREGLFEFVARCLEPVADRATPSMVLD